MADQDNYKTYVRDTRTTQSSGSSMALIVGGLVVAVAFILWLVLGTADRAVVTTEPATDTTNITVDPTVPADSTTNVTIEGDAPAADAAVPADPVETAPEATDAAPADGTEAAPANP